MIHERYRINGLRFLRSGLDRGEDVGVLLAGEVFRGEVDAPAIPGAEHHRREQDTLDFEDGGFVFVIHRGLDDAGLSTDGGRLAWGPGGPSPARRTQFRHVASQSALTAFAPLAASQ